MKTFISILFLVLFIGCATMQSLDISQRVRMYKASYSQTFQAVLSYCTIRGFAVTTVNKELGIINTDYKESDAAVRFFLGNYRIKITFKLGRASENEAQVVATISAEQQGAFGSWSQAVISRDEAIQAYQKVFDGIGENIK